VGSEIGIRDRLANALCHFFLGTCGAQSFVCGVLPGRVAARQDTTHKEKSEHGEGSVQPGEAENQVFPAPEKSGMTYSSGTIGLSMCASKGDRRPWRSPQPRGLRLRIGKDTSTGTAIERVTPERLDGEGSGAERNVG